MVYCEGRGSRYSVRLAFLLYELLSDLGFQPTDLIDRVRQLSNIASEAAMQHRLSYCVQGYADRIATDAKLREKVASEG